MSAQQRVKICYQQGVKDYKSGVEIDNPYGLGQLLERCAYAAGIYDAEKGYI